MARNLLSEMFGVEWEKSPGDRVVCRDWQCRTEGWAAKEIRVVAGNDPDPSCLYHELIGDAIQYRYRFHDDPPDPIPCKPPGINLSNTEWWDYIGRKESHNLAMAIQPYLEDRKLHWQSVQPLQRTNDASVDIASGPGSNASRQSQDAHVTMESRKVKKQPRRNTKYEGIDQALAEISKARPKNHIERKRRTPARDAKWEFGSPAWIRTTIHGSKGRCPTIRRPGKISAAEEMQLQCSVHP